MACPLAFVGLFCLVEPFLFSSIIFQQQASGMSTFFCAQYFGHFGPLGDLYIKKCSNLTQHLNLVGGLEHDFYFSIYWEFHHPN